MVRNTDNNFSSIRKARQFSILFFVCLIAAVSLFSISGNTGSISAEVNDEALGVIGVDKNTVFIFREQIESVELANSLDIGTKLSGTEKGKYLDGLYHNDLYEDYRLIIYTETPEYIVIKYDDGNILVFNMRTEKNTQDIYQKMLEK